MIANSNMQPGKLYELAVFISTLINNPKKSFDLGREIKFAGKLDDLVVRNHETGFNQYTFLQIKLVDKIEDNVIDSKVLMGEKRISLKIDDFKLVKYFYSYLRIKDQLNSRNQLKNEDKSKIQKLIIFTNTNLDQEELKRKVNIAENSIENSNDIIPNVDKDPKFYKIIHEKDVFFQKENLKSDLQILAEELAKYATSTNSNQMVLDIECFNYYHTALIDENVIKIEEDLKKKVTKKGKFSQDFIDGKNLSSRAQKLREKMTAIISNKQNNMAEAKWAISKDFDSRESKDKIFLPNYDISDNDIKDFFGVLEFRVNQLGVKDILDKIRNREIKKIFLRYYNTDPELIEFLIRNFVENWRKEEELRDAWLLNDKRSKFIEQLQSKLSKPQAIHKTQQYATYLEDIIIKYDLHFRDDCLFNEQNFLEETFVAIRTASNILSSIKMIEYLNKIEQKDYIFIDLENLLQKREIIQLIDAFKFREFNFLILSYKIAVDDNIADELFTKLADIISKDSQKRIIFITSVTEDSVINTLDPVPAEREGQQIRRWAQRVEKFDTYKEHNDMTIDLQQLVDTSKILEQEITIQDQPVKLRDCIVNNQYYKLIGAKIIENVVTNQKMKIGNKPPGTSDLEGAYSELFEEVNMETLVDKLLLKESNDIYVISGIPGSSKEDMLIESLNIPESKVNELKNRIEVLNQQNITRPINQRIQVADDQFKEGDFKQICHNNSERKIFWIHFRGDNVPFILAQIYNSDFYVGDERFNDVVIGKDVKELLGNSKLSEKFVIGVQDKSEFIKWLECTDDQKRQIEINSESSQNNMIKFVTYQDNMEDSFQQIIAANPDQTVHLLKFKENKLICRKTHGSLKSLRKYRARENTNTAHLIGEDALINEIQDQKVVIIAGDPGMGKSTTVLKLCNSKSAKEEPIFKSHWVIRVNLRDHLEAIGNIDFSNSDIDTATRDKITRFLSTVDKSINSDFARNLLDIALTNAYFAKPLLIVFDGFDEVLDKANRDKIISLLKHLKDKTEVKFWVTTRLHYLQTLEDELSTYAIQLEQMNNSSSKFIRKYLNNRLSLMLSQEELSEYTEAFLMQSKKMDIVFKDDASNNNFINNNFINNNFINNKFINSKFIRTPLHLYLMLEGSTGHFKEGLKHSSSIPDFSNLGNNIWEVYENFLDRKYGTYLKKAGIREQIIQKQYKVTFDNYYKNLAKSLTFKSEPKEDLKEFKDIVLSTGIVRSDGSNIDFIHPVFTDYFAAKVSINWIMKKSTKLSNPRKKEYLLTEILMKPDYKFIRMFMNVKLEEIIRNTTLPEESLKQFGEITSKLLQEAQNLLIDNNGNTILSIAFIENNGNLIYTILKIAESKFSPEQLFKFLRIQDKSKRTALHCAVDHIKPFNSQHNLLKLILEISESKFSPKQLFEFLKIQDERNRTAFHRALDVDDCDLQSKYDTVEFILNKTEIKFSSEQLFKFLMIRDESKRTILHCALDDMKPFNSKRDLFEFTLVTTEFLCSAEKLFDFVMNRSKGDGSALKVNSHDLLPQYKTVEFILNIAESKFSPKQLFHFLMIRNKRDRTALHCVLKVYFRDLQSQYRIVKSILKIAQSNFPPEQLFKFLMIRDESKRTALHCALDHIKPLNSTGLDHILFCIYQGILIPGILGEKLPRALDVYNCDLQLKCRIDQCILETARSNFSPEQLFKFLKIQDESKRTALHCALDHMKPFTSLVHSHGLHELILDIAESKFSPEQLFDFLVIRDDRNRTALHCALKVNFGDGQSQDKTVHLILNTAKSKFSSKQLFDFLMIQDKYGCTALHCALYNMRPFYLVHDILRSRNSLAHVFDLVRIEVEKARIAHYSALDVNDRDMQSKYDTVQFILKTAESNFSLEQLFDFLMIQNEDGCTALHRALDVNACDLQSQYKTVEFILNKAESKFSPEQLFEFLKIQDKSKRTALHCALHHIKPFNSQHNLLKLILDKAESKFSSEQLFEFLKIQDVINRTALHGALDVKDCDLLSKYKTVEFILNKAESKFSSEQLFEFLKIQDEINRTALHCALDVFDRDLQSKYDTVQVILNKAESNFSPEQLFKFIMIQDDRKCTALHRALDVNDCDPRSKCIILDVILNKAGSKCSSRHEFIDFISIPHERKLSALHCALDHIKPFNSQHNLLKLILEIAESKFSPEQLFDFLVIRDERNRTALHRALDVYDCDLQSKYDTVECILNKTESKFSSEQLFECLKIQDDSKRTALHCAVDHIKPFNSQHNLLKLILKIAESKFSPEQLFNFLVIRDERDNTALYGRHLNEFTVVRNQKEILLNIAQDRNNQDLIDLFNFQ